MSEEIHLLDTLETPPRGWEVVDESSGRLLKAETFQELVKRLANYRKDNGLPPGDPEAEIHSYLCSRFPERCGREPAALKFKEGLGKEDVESYLAFFKEVVLKKGGVPQEQADARAATCTSCPYNVKLGFCRGCFSLADKIAGVASGLKTKYDAALNECGVCGCIARLKCFTPLELVQGKDDFPDWCWVKQEAHPHDPQVTNQTSYTPAYTRRSQTTAEWQPLPG